MTAARCDGMRFCRDFSDDPLFRKGSIRIDGRKLHPVYLMTTKALAESKRDWDDFKLNSPIQPEDAWRPLDKGGCPFIRD